MLPQNLFFGAELQTIIVVLRKNKVDSNVLLIDASTFCDINGKKNVLRNEDINEIVRLVRERKNTPYSMLLSYESIVAHGYDLSWNKYKGVEETDDLSRTTEEVLRDIESSEASFAEAFDALKKMVK